MSRADYPLDGIHTEFDREYGRVGERRLLLDILKPEGARGPLPAVIFIHGGGFRAGKKTDVRPHMAGLTRRGFACISLDYRLSDEALFPAALLDVRRAVRWLRANAKSIGILPERFGAIGFSAGGTLVSFLGLSLEALNLGDDDPGCSSSVQAVVNCFGVSDMLEAEKARLDNSCVLAFIGVSPEEDPGAYRKASPLTYVSAAAAPHLIFYGSEDTVVPLAQSEDLLNALRSHGVPAEMVIWPGIGHRYPWDTPLETQSFDRIEAFYRRWL